MSDLHEKISEIWWSDLDPDDAIEKIIAKVRENDAVFNAYVAGEDNEFERGIRAKTVEACLAAVRKTHEECGGLSLHYAEQAIKGVDK